MLIIYGYEGKDSIFINVTIEGILTYQLYY